MTRATAAPARRRGAASATAGAAPAAPVVDAARARRFGRALRAWFRRHGRDLPWRRTRDPYRILVSELMLQQTQVARVLDYYARFLDRFPTLRHVAEAAPADVTGAWQGLGYYARARNLHALARHVTRDGGPGGLPSEPRALRELPGVGAYTAGAVASFAFERRAALVDTNVARVLRRVFAPEVDPRSGAGQKRLWAIAAELLPRTGAAAWTHNQALMELGALVCTARARHCGACPARGVCATFGAERAERAGGGERAARPTPPRRARRAAAGGALVADA